jgi:hypothetical protein
MVIDPAYMDIIFDNNAEKYFEESAAPRRSAAGQTARVAFPTSIVGGFAMQARIRGSNAAARGANRPPSE